MIRCALAGLMLVLAFSPPVVAAELDQVFGDGMVLQRQQPITVWGTGAPGESVSVTLGDTSRSTEVNDTGHWQVVFPAMQAGGPFQLQLTQGSGRSQAIRDVLVGDLWLCSGQSNMAWPVSRSSGYNTEALETFDAIRFLTVHRASDALPRMDFADLPQWTRAGPDTIPEFSAVCFSFARKLQKSEAVALGLVHSSWGGSGIKAWTSAAALEQAGGFTRQLELLETWSRDAERATTEFGAGWEEWWRQSVSESELPWMPDDNEDPSFKVAPGLQDWKSFGDPALAEHNGMVWFRKYFHLTEDQARQDGQLSLGGIDEVDVTWVNGHLAGSQFGWGTQRTYTVPAEALQPGQNVVVLNVLSTWGAGGMVGPRENMGLSFGADSVSLADGWEYREVATNFGLPPRAPWESTGGLTGLFNAMIAPLEGLRFAGALWYQGESDTGNAAPYAGLLSAMIADWRARFGKSLEFLIVQLPNFGELAMHPAESGWAAIRDAQRRVADADPDAGLVVTVDVGDRLDLHPPNKDIIGVRAANVARAMKFGGEGIADGLSPARAVAHGRHIVIEFAPADEVLVVAGDEKPVAFELCGAKASSCRYAEARLQQNRIYIARSSDDSATRVRHCWADAPVCNLYVASGLPVSSFEIAVSRENGRD